MGWLAVLEEEAFASGHLAVDGFVHSIFFYFPLVLELVHEDEEIPIDVSELLGELFIISFLVFFCNLGELAGEVLHHPGRINHLIKWIECIIEGYEFIEFGFVHGE